MRAADVYAADVHAPDVLVQMCIHAGICWKYVCKQADCKTGRPADTDIERLTKRARRTVCL